MSRNLSRRMQRSSAGSSRAAPAPRAALPPGAYSAPALEKGLDILEFMASREDRLSQLEIAQGLGRSTGEIYRMLDVLVRRGYLHRDPDSGTYSNTLALFELAHRLAPVNTLLESALPPMKALARRLRQSLHLVVHFEGRILVVAEAPSPDPISLAVRLGAHFPFRPERISARLLAAMAAGEERDRLFAELAADLRGTGARAALGRRLHAIRVRGYDEAASQTTRGIVDVAYPLFDRGARAVASLVLTYLPQRDAPATVPQARAALAATASAVSRSLGARPSARD